MGFIRAIKDTDYPVLSCFWRLAGMPINVPEMYPKDTSYIYEKDDSILYAVALHVVKGLPRAYVEGFIRNPLKAPDEAAVRALQEHIDINAKYLGINTLYALTKDEAVHNHHKLLGYQNSDVMMYTSIRRL